MMFVKVSTIVVIALCFLAGQSDAQECFAQSVVDLKLDTSHNLTWSLGPDESCEVQEYLVYIFHPGQTADYTFTQTETFLDVSFLEVCEEWIFVVVPVSGSTLGAERRIVEKLPLPSNANLTLTRLLVDHHTYQNRTLLGWDLVDKRLGNCSLTYRITVEKEGSPVVEDYYVNTNYSDLYFLSSCTNYTFGVRAINTAPPTIEGPLRSELHYLGGRPQNPPVLLDSQIGATSANFSFGLESEVRNPCYLRSLFFAVGDAYSQTISLHDYAPRYPVNVTATNLEPHTTYFTRAYVYNQMGWSNPTEMSIQTLIQDLDEELSEEADENY